MRYLLLSKSYVNRYELMEFDTEEAMADHILREKVAGEYIVAQRMYPHMVFHFVPDAPVVHTVYDEQPEEPAVLDQIVTSKGAAF